MQTPTSMHRDTIDLLARLAPGEGYTQSHLPGVRLMRADRAMGRTPVLYEPSIVVVCQGSKRGYLGDRVYRYDARHFLVLSAPLPFTTEIDATPAAPLLAITVNLDLQVVADLSLALDSGSDDGIEASQGIVSTPLDDALSEVTLRLLRVLSSQRDSQILGPGVVRELHYRVMSGPQGAAVRAVLASHGRFGRVTRALRHIHAHYSEPQDVRTLATGIGLSVPAFHAHFKAATGTSPIQYLKAIRLHQARLLMIREQLPAGAAALRVGYQSTSQFNREFKRLFGRSPGEEARQMKQAFSLLPATQFEAVATHR